MQLTTVGKEIWRGARQAQRLDEAGAGDSTVQERLRKLKLAHSLRKRKADWAEIGELVGTIVPGQTHPGHLRDDFR